MNRKSPRGRTPHLAILSLCCVALCTAAVAAVGPDDRPNALLPGEKAEEFVPLFNGENLEGWTLDRTARSDCFEVRDNLLYCTGRGDYETLLRTTKMYENFDLRLEYRTPGWTESGVLFHVPPIGRAIRLGAKVQIYHRIGGNLEPNFTGSIFGVVSPDKDYAKGSNEWQTMRILMDWPSLKVWINETQVHDLNCEEIEELKYDERTGYIALQDIQSDVFFRRIRIRDLPGKDKWVTLFNGKDLAGWHEADHAEWEVRMPNEQEPVWTCSEHPSFRFHEFARCPYCTRNLVQTEGEFLPQPAAPLPGKAAAGVIHAERSTGYLITDKAYQDFELKAIIRESPGANGGIFFRWTREVDGDRGYEIQLRNSPDASHPSGSIYKYDRTKDDELIKGSEWYLLHIIAEGKHLQVWIDGKKVSEITDAKKTKAGQISLQMHSNASWVEWKDIKIKEL